MGVVAKTGCPVYNLNKNSIRRSLPTNAAGATAAWHLRALTTPSTRKRRMQPKFSFYIVDDDPDIIELVGELLTPAARKVSANASGLAALPDIISQKPDCVLLDIMMPEVDGLELCRQLRLHGDLADTRIVMLTGKPYDFDRQRALALGADGYITKPMDSQRFLSQLLDIIADKIKMTFWGVRGTLPVPGPATVYYGGNTSCVSLEFPRGNLFVFDAGTGIKPLSDYLTTHRQAPLDAKILISHPHQDHLNALPFFIPLFTPGNTFEICGPPNNAMGIRQLVAGQMDGVYFPIKIKEFRAGVVFRDLKEETFDSDNVTIATMLLSHPGNCLGYRLQYKDRVVCYITDNELFPSSSPHYNPSYRAKLAAFVKRADALIIDCTYSDADYALKTGWGHSSVATVVDLAHHAAVKRMYLFHHDPSQLDDDIRAKLAAAQNLLARKSSTTECLAPREGQTCRI